jgi:hypothetical protein
MKEYMYIIDPLEVLQKRLFLKRGVCHPGGFLFFVKEEIIHPLEI